MKKILTLLTLFCGANVVSYAHSSCDDVKPCDASKCSMNASCDATAEEKPCAKKAEKSCCGCSDTALKVEAPVDPEIAEKALECESVEGKTDTE